MLVMNLIADCYTGHNVRNAQCRNGIQEWYSMKKLKKAGESVLGCGIKDVEKKFKSYGGVLLLP